MIVAVSFCIYAELLLVSIHHTFALIYDVWWSSERAVCGVVDVELVLF